MKKIPQSCINIQKKTGETLYKENLLAPNDNIIIGLSGGKDSLVLTDILARQRKHLPFNINLTAAHIIIEEIGYKTNLDFLYKFCDSHKIELKVISAEIPKKDSNKNPCFICSWTRRKKLFELTANNNYNKLALGHNLDDAIETLLMNMTHHSSISSLPYSVSMFDGRIDLIRPLLNFTNNQLLEYSELMNFPKELKTCIHGENTSRKKISAIIDQLTEINKDAKKNIFRSTKNIFTEYIP